MDQTAEMQALVNSPCEIQDASGNKYKCSFPDVEQLVTLQANAKLKLLEDTKRESRAMLEGGASQDMIDGVWKRYQEADEQKRLENCLLDPQMFKELIGMCLVKNHPDLTQDKLKELLTAPNLSKIGSYFSALKNVITLPEETAEKN
jgi:hypothetical protein